MPRHTGRLQSEPTCATPRFNKTIVEYLQFARMFNEKFPGFDTDIHGLVEKENGKRKDYVDCVRGI